MEKQKSSIKASRSKPSAKMELRRVTKLPTRFRDEDIVLQGDAEKIFNKIKNTGKTCSKIDVRTSIDNIESIVTQLPNSDKDGANVKNLINILEDMTIEEMDSKVAELTEEMENKDGQNGGAVMGMNATALIIYLIASAIAEGAKYGYEQITKLLAGGLKVLEFLSNKEDCAQLVAREYLGKRIMRLIQFFFLGSMINEIKIPMEFIVKLANLLYMLVPYVVTKGVSGGSITAIGYLIYHFVNYYGKVLSATASKRLQDLNAALDALENATSENVVKQVIEKSNEVKDTVSNLMKELSKNKPIINEKEREELMNKIQTNLNSLKDERIGELDNLTINKIKNKFAARQAPYIDRYISPNMRYNLNVNDDDSEESDMYSPYGGAKRRKKTQKRKKNKSIKKTTEKSSKTKKHHK